MTTADEINPFEKNYWNLIQTLAWVYLRTDELVRLADDEVDDWGMHKEELTTPDGNTALRDVANDKPGALHVEMYGFGEAKFSKLSDAATAIIRELQTGNITCYGVANNTGDLTQIQKTAWADLKFFYDPNLAAPQDFMTRRHVTRWHGLKFKRGEIVTQWPEVTPDPEALNKREIQKQNTQERDKKIQKAMEVLAEEKISRGESFKKSSLAYELYKEGVFSIDSATIERIARVNW